TSFSETVLNLPKGRTWTLNENEICYTLPVKEKLILKPNSNSRHETAVAVEFLVKNGFEKFYVAMQKKAISSKKFKDTISPVTPASGGDFFSLTDPDGNKFIFRKKKRLVK